MKNKFFVGIEIVFGISVCVSASLGCFIWLVLGVDAWGEDILVTAVLTIMMAVLPTLMLIGCIVVFAAKIQIDKNGITRSLFGINKKVYLWEEIDHIKLFGNCVASSISFYKKRKKSLMFHFSKNERICFYLDEKRWTVINYYIPQRVKELIEKAKSDLKKKI